MKKIGLIFYLLLITQFEWGQSNTQFWYYTNPPESNSEWRIKPLKFKTIVLDHTKIHDFLSTLGDNHNSSGTILLPTPDGGSMTFNVWKSPIMAPGLAAKFPNISTYTAVAQTDNNMTAKLDYTDYGFHAMIFAGEKTYLIDPVFYQGGSLYQVYYKSDYTKDTDDYSACLQDENSPIVYRNRIPSDNDVINNDSPKPLILNGSNIKKYRLAIANTYEYAKAVTGKILPTKSEVFSYVVTTINRVNGIYERELAVQMIIVDSNDKIIYNNAGSEPYDYNFDGYMLLGENQSNIDDVIGNAHYDIGHVFSTGGGGIASLGSVCFNPQKAMGVTGLPNPIGDPFDVDFVSHEMGHQFGANHTFNFCFGNENPSTAFEPGSGSSIMAYTGICGIENLQNNSDDYFHAISLTEIANNLQGFSSIGVANTCGQSFIGHTIIDLPDIEAEYNIPAQSAFELEAPEASWADGTSIQYVWEQWNTGNLKSPEINGATVLLAPSFRTRYPKSNRVRVFPLMDSVLKNKYNFLGERTPKVTRDLKFKVTARAIGDDGFGVAHVSENQVTVHAYNTGQIFTVTSPNSASDVLEAAKENTITWEVAGTNEAPINASKVDVYLSLDGGMSFPILLADNIDNIGTAKILFPDSIGTDYARIKIKGSNNIFFDVSNNNFKINGTPNNLQVPKNTKLCDIYPNPTNGDLFITALDANATYQLRVLDLFSRTLIQKQFDNATVVSMHDYASGIYILEITDMKTMKRSIEKIVKK